MPNNAILSWAQCGNKGSGEQVFLRSHNTAGDKLTRYAVMCHLCPAANPVLRPAQVMIAACDTFRSGAVEQLKTHCARLGVPLYERGYEKDPAKVAFEAQRAAARASTDVLLVDTAGGACESY